MTIPHMQKFTENQHMLKTKAAGTPVEYSHGSMFPILRTSRVFFL